MKSLDPIRTQLKFQSHLLVIVLSICAVVLGAFFTGEKEVELFSIKLDAITGANFAILVVSVVILVASGTMKNIGNQLKELLVPEDAPHFGIDKKKKDVRTELAREPVLLNTFNIFPEGSIGGFILLMILAVLPAIIFGILTIYRSAAFFSNPFLHSGLDMVTRLCYGLAVLLFAIRTLDVHLSMREPTSSKTPRNIREPLILWTFIGLNVIALFAPLILLLIGLVVVGFETSS